MTVYHLHLVSDATGETINAVARACLVQFEGVEAIEHVWSLVRTRGQMEKTLSSIAEHPGPVLFTLVNDSLRALLVEGCRDIEVPCIPVLDPIIHRLASYFGVEISGRPGLQHALDAAEQASRWEAGAPTSRGRTRSDLGGEGVRPACSLGARFAVSADKARSEVA